MKKIKIQNQKSMEKYSNEELLEFLPTGVRDSKELTKKQKAVLGQFMIYNGLEQTKENGFFFRSNQDLCYDCDIQEKTLIAAVRKLELLGFIEREKGARGKGASEYRVNEKAIDDYCKSETEDYSINYSKQIAEMADKIRELEITVKMLVDKITVMEGQNYSTDTETDTDIDTETDIDKEIYNNIYNKEKTEVGINRETSVIEEMVNEENEPSAEEEVSPASRDNCGYTFSNEELQELKEVNRIVNPCILQLQRAKSRGELDELQGCVVKEVRECLKGCSSSVMEYVCERLAGAIEARREEFEERNKEEISKQLEYQQMLVEYY